MAGSTAQAVAPEALTSGARPSRVVTSLRRSLRWLGVVPFGVYVALFLIVPTIAIVIGAFQDTNTGAWTMDNIKLATGGDYLPGLRNSVLLSIASAAEGGPMATVASVEAGAQAPAPAARPAARRRSFPVWRWAILLIAGVYFLIPLYSGLRFAGLKAFRDIFKQAGFMAAVGLSLQLALVTTILTLVLMVPTVVYVHLRLPRIRRGMDGITILPIVIPPIVLIIGVLKVAPGFLLSTPYLLALVYVILAMPFAYRSLDAGLRAFDLKTMVEASNSLGAAWPTTLWRVVLPNIRTAILSATVLTVALVLGEYTMASLALWQTFPVWIVNFEQSSGPVSVAASLLALFVTWLLLMLIVSVGSWDSRRRGGAQVALFTVAAPRESRQAAGEQE
jgi:putative spermidine/putrescine transport system permease protein